MECAVSGMVVLSPAAHAPARMTPAHPDSGFIHPSHGTLKAAPRGAFADPAPAGKRAARLTSRRGSDAPLLAIGPHGSPKRGKNFARVGVLPSPIFGMPLNPKHKAGGVA